MTIYDIKARTQETAPYFFTRKTMKFFGQTLKDFKVKKQTDGRYKITAPHKDSRNILCGETVRYFNPLNNNLEIV